MRVIVSLYRGIIALFFLLSVMGLCFLFGLSLSALTGAGTFGWNIGILGVLYAVLCLMALILTVGITATFVSMHDRICELVLAVENRSYGEGPGFHRHRDLD